MAAKSRNLLPFATASKDYIRSESERRRKKKGADEKRNQSNEIDARLSFSEISELHLVVVGP